MSVEVAACPPPLLHLYNVLMRCCCKPRLTLLTMKCMMALGTCTQRRGAQAGEATCDTGREGPGSGGQRP